MRPQGRRDYRDRKEAAVFWEMRDRKFLNSMFM